MRNFTSSNSSIRNAAKASSSSNMPVFDDALLRSVSSVVEYILRKNGTDWVTEDMVADVYGEALEHIVNKTGSYDPEKGANFRTWACKVAKNHAVTACERLYRESQRLEALESVMPSDGFDEWDYLCGVSDEVQAEDHGTMDQGPEDFGGVSSLDRCGEAMAWKAKESWFMARTEKSLSASERELFGMLLRGASSSQIMEQTGKSRASVDTALSRLRAKCRAINQDWLTYSSRIGLE